MKSSLLKAVMVCLIAAGFCAPSMAGGVRQPHLQLVGGTIKYLSWRQPDTGQALVLFHIIASDGTNSCGGCPADPAGFNTGGFCWMPDSQKSQLSLFLTAQLENRAIVPSVMSATDCTVMQFVIADPT